MSTLVLKFGGASVSDPESFANVADIIIQRSESFNKCVVVVSAMGNTTSQLFELAAKVHDHPPKRELDMLVSVGERVSISLLAMALSRRSKGAISFTGSQSGIITSDHHTEARIVDVRPCRIFDQLIQNKIVIVAGFQGVSLSGEITTLGRGGSDTSAVALAVALSADKVEFYKDVKGVYSKDPKKHSDALFHDELSYDQALSIVDEGARVLHKRSLLLAKKNNLPLHVLSFLDFNGSVSKGTIISDKGGSPRRDGFVYEDLVN
ncbi:MAG: aspartate kinase [Chlamydiae bacterium]|nr:aspartate kinase [Chlamydiota bacterium]